MNRFAYFPCMVYRDEHPEWVEQIETVVNNHHINSNDKLLHQTASLVNDPRLKFFIHYLEDITIEVLKEQGYSVDRYNFYVSALWGQEINCHAATDIHIHKNSQISGWFFLSTPKDGSYPVFYDPRIRKQMVELDYVTGEDVTNATPSIHFNNIEPGTIIFTNSWLQHQLIHNKSQEKTKALHFIVSHRDS